MIRAIDQVARLRRQASASRRAADLWERETTSAPAGMKNILQDFARSRRAEAEQLERVAEELDARWCAKEVS